MLDRAAHLDESHPVGGGTTDENYHVEDQLSAWVDDHADALYRFALRRVKDQHTVEDLLQETYLAALRSSDRFRGASSTRTWLVAILRLKIIDHYRRHENTATLLPTVESIGSSRQGNCKLRKWNCEPSQTVENYEFWQALRQCLDKLPATLNQAFLLRELDGCTPGQISELLNITQKNLAVRVYRARQLLRDCLDRNWFNEA